MLLFALGVSLTSSAQKTIKEINKYVVSVDSMYFSDSLEFRDSIYHGSIGFKYLIKAKYQYITLFKLSFVVENKMEKIEEIYYFKDKQLVYAEINEYKYNQHISTLSVYYVNGKYVVLFDGTKFELKESEKKELINSIFEDIEFYKTLLKKK